MNLKIDARCARVRNLMIVAVAVAAVALTYAAIQVF